MVSDSVSGFGGHTWTEILETPIDHFFGNLASADHFVVAVPMCWIGMPTKLNRLIEWAFMPAVLSMRTIQLGRFRKPMPWQQGAQMSITKDPCS